MRGFYEASRLLSKCYKTFPPEQDLLWHDYVRSVVVGLKLHEVVLGVNVGVKRPVVWSLLGVHWLEAHVVYADILRGTICRSVTHHSARDHVTTMPRARQDATPAGARSSVNNTPGVPLVSQRCDVFLWSACRDDFRISELCAPVWELTS